MNQKQAAEHLNEKLHEWVEQHFKKFPGLVGVLQFGSTIKPPLKYETDLDLLLLFESLPKSRWEQFQLTSELEDALNADLKILDGFHIEVSFILKQESQLDHLSSFYLDFPDTSKIWFDPKGLLKELLENINQWIFENGAHKIQKGNLWYWVYSSQAGSAHPVSFRFTKEKKNY